MRLAFASILAVALAWSATSTARAETSHTELVQQTMATFAEGLKRDDLSALHAAAGPAFRAAQTPDSIRTEFSALAALQLDLRVLRELDPVFTNEQRQGETLQLAGFYPSTPLRAYFDFSYERVGNDWKLLGIGVRVTPVIRASTMRHNSGWTIVLDVLDPAKEIHYALPGKEFRATGFGTQRDPNSGDLMPRSTIDVAELPDSLQVKVITRARTIGPVTLRFDADAELIRQAIETLEITPTAWAYLRTFDERELLYFTHLVTSRCGIEKVRYSLDSDQLDREYTLPPCNPKDPSGVPHDFEIVSLDRKPQFVAVQLDYRNGQRSQLVRIPHSEPTVEKPEPAGNFLAEHRAQRPLIHPLLEELQRRLPAAARAERLMLLGGTLWLDIRSPNPDAAIAALRRASSWSDVAVEGDITPDARAGKATFTVRATAKAASPASTDSSSLKFLVTLDFDSAYASMLESLRKIIAQEDDPPCSLIMSTPSRSSDKEAHPRVTVKTRLRCSDANAMRELFQALERSQPSWFIDDLKIRHISLDLRDGESLAHIDIGFDLYTYRRSGILR